MGKRESLQNDPNKIVLQKLWEPLQLSPFGYNRKRSPRIITNYYRLKEFPDLKLLSSSIGEIKIYDESNVYVIIQNNGRTIKLFCAPEELKRIIKSAFPTWLEGQTSFGLLLFVKCQVLC